MHLPLQVARIMRCCVNKKKFLMKLKKTMIGPFMLLSLRGDKTCIEVNHFGVFQRIQQVFDCVSIGPHSHCIQGALVGVSREWFGNINT